MCLLTGCMTAGKAKKRYLGVKNSCTQVDAAIVPGLAFHNKNWGTLMKRRVIWAWILYKNGIVKHVIFSGGAVYTPYCEAYVMGLYAQKLGMPRSAISYDTVAEHSTENVFYSYLIAKREGFRTIAFVSDTYQTSFLKGFINRRFRTDIVLIPVVKDSVEKYWSYDTAIDLKQALLGDTTTFQSIRERQPFYKRVKGTFGRNINWKQYPHRTCPAL